MTKTHTMCRAIALVAALGLVAGACGDDDDSAEPTAEPTATDTAEPPPTPPSRPPTRRAASRCRRAGRRRRARHDRLVAHPEQRSGHDRLADRWPTQFTADHPNVTINITVMENEAFKAAIQTNMQAGDVPDLFQSWGGGGLSRTGRCRARAGHHRRDVADVIGDLNPGDRARINVDGKQYGLPFNVGMVGFWYNKDLFAQAGIEAPADDVGRTARADPDAEGRRHHADRRRRRRQVAGPLLVLVPDGPARRRRRDERDRRRQQLRTCPTSSRPARRSLDLVALEPFQEGFLGAGWDAPDGESGTMASEGAAMDLMGQWAPGAFREPGRRRQRRPTCRSSSAGSRSPRSTAAPDPDRRVRRRRRLRRRQGRPAGDGRVPEFITNVDNQRRSWAIEQRPSGQPERQRRRHRSEHADRARRARPRRRSSSCSSTSSSRPTSVRR